MIGGPGCRAAHDGPREPAIPAGAKITSWNENGAGGRYVLQLIDGRAPTAEQVVSGVVLTDADCDPDALELSHCHDEIRLANVRVVAVIDTHLMRIHPCLQPGMSLAVRRLGAGWVVATQS